MKTIADEINSFLAETKIRQYVLARESGFSIATISRVASGVQKDVRLSTAYALRAAMTSLRGAAGGEGKQP